jgi:predicted nucleic acid-binding protein
MTVVVSDTSPLSYLIQIKCEHLLPALFERILVPAAVIRELENPGTPAVVRAWLTRLPEWIVVREVQVVSDPALDELDSGERHAIHLAQDEKADLLLMDERAGVGVARQRGLMVTGTLGVLLRAAERGLVNTDAALRALEATTFRSTPSLIEEVKRRARGRNLL